MRYSVKKIKDGMVRLSSFNPFNKPIVITINDITRMNYIAGKHTNEFTVTAGDAEMKIRMPTMIVPEIKSLYKDIISRGRISGSRLAFSDSRLEKHILCRKQLKKP